MDRLSIEEVEMYEQVARRIVGASALKALAATSLVVFGASAPLAAATQAPRRLPNCTWPISKGQIDATLGVSVTSPSAPMQFTEPVPGGSVSWTMCAYYADNGTKAGAVGDVVIEYFGGVGSQRVFMALERGFASSKHLGHVTTVNGIGSEAFYAIAARQTYLIAHVGTTMFVLFAERPPAKVITLGRMIARAL
jgi:hypothetical protein